jgi:hypothetical protein
MKYLKDKDDVRQFIEVLQEHMGGNTHSLQYFKDEYLIELLWVFKDICINRGTIVDNTIKELGE